MQVAGDMQVVDAMRRKALPTTFRSMCDSIQVCACNLWCKVDAGLAWRRQSGNTFRTEVLSLHTYTET